MNLRMTGTSEIRIDSIMVGNKLVMTPRMTFGQLLMKSKKGATWVKYEICDMEPTTATGIDLVQPLISLLIVHGQKRS